MFSPELPGLSAAVRMTSWDERNTKTETYKLGKSQKGMQGNLTFKGTPTFYFPFIKHLHGKLKH